MKHVTGLATEEMTSCPSCGDLTFEIGPCFRCCATSRKPARRSSGLSTAAGRTIAEGDLLEYNSPYHSKVSLRVCFGQFTLNPDPDTEIGLIGFYLQVLGSPFVWALSAEDAAAGYFEHYD